MASAAFRVRRDIVWQKLSDWTDRVGDSIYFRDPDGARLELLCDPLGEMGGSPVL